MQVDLRKKTCLIVTKDGKYLVGWNYLIRDLNWSRDYYDAWRTRDREKAEKVAQKCGGTLMLFNPIVGQIRDYAI